MKIKVRTYSEEDYAAVKKLYLDDSLYGGQFDEDRDSEDRLKLDADNILVAEVDGEIAGTVTMFYDSRLAWLFRFAAKLIDSRVAQALQEEAELILKQQGHNQVIVYSKASDERLSGRYEKLGFTKGGDFTAFWKEIR